MATLNTITRYDVDDDESGDNRALQDPILTWNWATWPANLRKAAISTSMVIALLAAAIALARWADQNLSKKLKTQEALKTQAQTKLKNSDQERTDIDQNIPLLRQLESQGIFGEEKRLEWIEQLRAIEKRWAGVKLQYDISIQNPWLNPDTGSTGFAGAVSVGAATTTQLPSGETAQSFGLFQTEMKLTLKVLHEGDVLAIIDELKAANLGRFSVKKCSFKRPGGSSPSISAAGTPSASSQFAIGQPLESECLLTWVSMKAYTP